jgi:hypothetical protein
MRWKEEAKHDCYAVEDDVVLRLISGITQTGRALPPLHLKNLLLTGFISSLPRGLLFVTLKSCPIAAVAAPARFLAGRRLLALLASGAALRPQHDGLSKLQSASFSTRPTTIPSGAIPACGQASEWMVAGRSLNLLAPASQSLDGHQRGLPK